MQNVYLFQPQYAIEFRKENNYWLPYSAGCIWSYAAQFDDIKENFVLRDLIFRREPIDQVLERMEDPAVAGFSCYVWNERYCLAMAEQIKQRWPRCVIVFGGPQASGAMLKHNFVDSIIMGEGEENFLECLRTVLRQQPVEQFYQKQRLENLEIPSPYTTGVFDTIIKNNPGAIWSTTLETNRGCPFACTFCDWGSTTYSKVKKFDLSRIKADLEWCVRNPISYIFVADANFGVFKERDVEIAKMIRNVADRGRIDSVNVQYAKNSTDVVFTIAKILGDLSRGVTVSVQSMHDQTLDAIKRKNLDVNNIQHLMQLSEQYDVATYTEVILGLPLETMESWKQGFNNILEMGQHNSIDMWFAQLLTNSELSQLSSRQQYGIKSVIAKDYMPLFNPNDWRGIEEDIELINQTNTMSTDEMIECYMYGWMIMHFHVGGYSQLYAKYCRNRKGITYRQFYDCLFDQLQQQNFFQEHFEKIRTVAGHYLQTGEMLKLDRFTKGGHGIHAPSYEFIYDHKQHAYSLAQSVAEQFGDLDSELIKLQTNFIFDTHQTFPIQVCLPFDLATWQDTVCQYQVLPKLAPDQEFDFYRHRRQGFIKNKITKSLTAI
jgi:putative methyltransferase